MTTPEWLTMSVEDKRDALTASLNSGKKLIIWSRRETAAGTTVICAGIDHPVTIIRPATREEYVAHLPKGFPAEVCGISGMHYYEACID